MTDQELALHAPILGDFPRWEGIVPAGYCINWVGAMTNLEMVDWDDFEIWHTTRHETPPLPVFDEEYFEWLDVLESVRSAQDRYVMIELGAGYGRWITNAFGALQRYCQHTSQEISSQFIAVEPEPTHYRWLKQTLAENEMLPKCKLYKNAITDHDNYVWFTNGQSKKWYGQSIIDNPSLSWKTRLANRAKHFYSRWFHSDSEDHYSVQIPAVSLTTVLKPLEVVDLIDLDVQGSELKILSSSPELLNEKVKRVHIGTHGRYIEEGLRKFFHKQGWENIHDYSCHEEQETPYGVINFVDGVQSWVNPRLVAAQKAA
ncbi:MAG: FkbM family methyltransferase [Pirellulaceae bacterium]|nr:FkbM family methyltransferase [Pirellulaceae bacterium]